MKQRMLLGPALLMGLICASCQPRRAPKLVLEYDRPLPPGQLALRKITDPNRFPDFAEGWRDLGSLQTAIRKSLSYLAKPSSKQYFPYGDVNHERVVKSLDAFLTLLDSGAHSNEVNGLVHAYFDVYESVGCDDRGTVLFTGYYTPIFDGSFTRTLRFGCPLYKVPSDLVKGPDGQTLGRRAANGQIVTYPTRAVIEDAAMLRGQELVWLEDPFEVYIAHVQGSARIRLPDGQVVTAGYAGNNGQEYQSVARMLIDDGKIASDRMSLAAMIDYFKDRPGEVDRYVRRNPRYVFFQIGEGPPRGCLNEPVTAWRTIATDKSVFPRAALAFISTNLPQMERGVVVTRSYNGFVLDQDAGGAIRAPGRCDVYMGMGDEAGQLAGQTHQEGHLYYLFLKP
ncbi:MAG: MltA domain-containing protein [Sedimentisphaerales bacterium]|nr:MltA domain-containing protein [Sedimentisphaerales bacterium]